jgi:hypothetical protein
MSTDTPGPLPDPAAEARWWEQNAHSAQQIILLRQHPNVEKYWGNRDKLGLYTADQMRAYALQELAAERERCAPREAELRGQLKVLADLLDEADKVLDTIVVDSEGDCDRMDALQEQIAAAIRAVRMPGVDIDAAHRRPDACAP